LPGEAQVLGLSASLPLHLREVKGVIDAVHDTSTLKHVRILVGGYLFRSAPDRAGWVGADGFAVTLSFDDMPERLRVPFAAITSFADPSVNFGLQFQDAADAAAPPEDAAEAEAEANVVSLENFRKR